MKDKKTHGVQLFIRCVVRGPDGKIIRDTGVRPSRSFVIQFLEFIYALFDGPSSLKATDTSNSEQYMYVAAWPASDVFRIDAGINTSGYGPVVGTGDAAEANTDYKLETQLTEGTGAGKITHGAVLFVATAVVGANVDLVVKRAFTNNTGSTITVKEAGIYSKWEHAPNKYYHCIVRDVLGAGVDVPDKCSLTVIYTIRTTV